MGLDANKRWLFEFSTLWLEVLITNRSNHCPLVLNNEDYSNGKMSRRVFKYEAQWALEDGEQAIQLAWQSRTFSPNC